MQIKERDQEFRINELKIKELRRQLPAKALKPLEQKYKAAAAGQQVLPTLPPPVPAKQVKATPKRKEDAQAAATNEEAVAGEKSGV